MPWIEKYRPKTLDEVVGNAETIDRLKIIASEGNLPNILISGLPGIGKTSSINCLARALLGPKLCHTAVLELNASDDRGIDTVRHKIKMFAQTKMTLPLNRHKLVILDEADSMTMGAQQALRRTMEIYSHTTRFALACNNSTKIIEPIQSRCAILRFTFLSNDMILSRLLTVCEAENVPYDQDGLAAILFTAEGDMRHALNNLQATFSGFGHVSETNVFKVCDQPHPTAMKVIIKGCIECANIHDKACIGQQLVAEKAMDDLFHSGYSSFDIIGTVFRVVKAYDMNDKLKLMFMKEIGTTHMCIADGATSALQLHGLVARLCLRAKELAATMA